MRASRNRLAVGCLAGLAVLTACGSTVRQRSSLPEVDAGTSTLATGPSSGTAGTALVRPGAGAVTAPGQVAVTRPGLASAPSAAGPTVTGGSAAPVAASGGPTGTALGVTATTIKIGVYTAQGFSSFASSAGFSVATGDQAAEAKAIINYLNAHGGLAGRTIVPVFHDFDVATAETNLDSEYESACAAWTQDQHVYAVVSPVGTLDNTLYDCLSKAGVATVSAGESQDAGFLQKYGDWYYQPSDLNLRRILSDNVDALAGAGFFGTNPKIGVVQVDNPNETAAVNYGLKPALARHGLTLTDTVAVPAGSSGPSAYSSAVLRFQAEGITHVLFTFLGSPLLFMTNAENQHYYPSYGLHSRVSPAALLQGNAPARQQHGAMGIGWQPMNDVDAAHDPGVLNPKQKLCLQLIRQSGQDPTVRATALIGLWLCDNFFFLQDALAHAPSFSIAGLRAGAESLSDYQAASTFRSGFGPGRLHDGASAYRLFAFKDDCACYQYVSPLRPTPDPPLTHP